MHSKIILCSFVCFFLVLSALTAMNASAQNARETSVTERFVSIDFNNVDINVFIKFISELTTKNFVVDQRVKGKVTIISPAKISIKEAYKVFESVLEVHGFTTVKAGEIIKIVPSPDARSKNIETRLKEEADSPEDKVVTQLIPLKYASPEEIKRLFAPLISKNSVILAYPPTNMLIVTDVYSNIKRLLLILSAIDVSGMGQELSVIPLEYANANEFIKILNSIFQTKRKPRAKEFGTSVQFVADERTNAIIVLASEVETARIKKLIQMLDKETPRGKEKIRVYYLENAKAEDLAKVLQSLSAKTGPAAKGKKAPLISQKVKITADKATNSLIIVGNKDDYLILEDIIKKLDIRRRMVYIESLIMEVNVDKDFRLGVQWLAGGKTKIGGKDAAFGGGFRPEVSMIPAPLTALPSLSGFSMGVFTDTINIGNIVFPNLAAIVQAYKKDKDVHFLSTPQILTTDNEEATITVGKNVPFQTRSAADAGTATYSSYEYRDVGITLRITPQISKDRLVRLNIFQEVTKLDELATTSADRPTTLKRTIKTTVIVKDKSTVVIGGLIDDSFTKTTYKTPCLGDIPLFGMLFRSVSKASEKTNLYVFLTPHVIENSAEAEEIYKDRKEQMDLIEEGKIKMYKWGWDKFDTQE
ncbi:MAG: type II secretion system secretin GspD [Candidatus Desulfatibia sp.]|uniref:type II secretion system secretin GspD n=1 Tax=Candidatus Desulfatibia sp. TaxID=3101189 RepID=UPI002F2E7CED